MSDGPPSAEEQSIPSSVRKAGAEALIAEQEAGDYTHNDDLRALVEKWRRSAEYMQTNAEEYADPDATGKAAEVLEDAADELEAAIGSNAEGE